MAPPERWAQVFRPPLRIVGVRSGWTSVAASAPNAAAEWAARPRGHRVRVVTHRRNRGKAAALRTGFAAAAEAGYTHAVTLDTDGQLDSEFAATTVI